MSLRSRIEHVLSQTCYPCGRWPDDDGDHSCPCPLADGDCTEHVLHPVTSLAGIRAALSCEADE